MRFTKKHNLLAAIHFEDMKFMEIFTMKKIITIALSLILVFALVGCGAKTSSSINSEKPYGGAPKIVLNGCDYFTDGISIVAELPEGYSYAGELTDEEKEYAHIDGSKYYTQNGADTIDDFYVYQECGTVISDTEVDNTQRQWAYVKWSK